MGDPGYEAGASAAAVIGAPVARVPLTKSFAHDVKAMAAVKAMPESFTWRIREQSDRDGYTEGGY